MGLYLVIHELEGADTDSEESIRQLQEVNQELGVSWIRSFESEAGERAFCIYQAPDEESLLYQARCLGLSIVELVRVSEVLPPGRRRAPSEQSI